MYGIILRKNTPSDPHIVYVRQTGPNVQITALAAKGQLGDPATGMVDIRIQRWVRPQKTGCGSEKNWFCQGEKLVQAGRKTGCRSSENWFSAAKHILIFGRNTDWLPQKTGTGDLRGLVLVTGSYWN